MSDKAIDSTTNATTAGATPPSGKGRTAMLVIDGVPASPSAKLDPPSEPKPALVVKGPRGTVAMLEAPPKRGGTERMLPRAVSHRSAEAAETAGTPSPWAQGDDALDVRALPSATAPAPTPAILGPAEPDRRRATRIAVAIGLFASIGIVVVLMLEATRTSSAPATVAPTTAPRNAGD